MSNEGVSWKRRAEVLPGLAGRQTLLSVS